MQESRLFRILYHLLEKGRATAPELAEKLEVSVRTIYRDIDALSSAGIPVYVTAGRNGGVQLLEDYVLNKSLFSDREKQEILSGLQSLSAVRYSDAEPALKKLHALFQIKMTDWIEIDFTRWGSKAEQENELFDKLKQAIFENRIISFKYFNSSGYFSGRNAIPVKLIYKDRAWYLYAFCLLRSDYRLFRLTRMKDLALTGKPAEHILPAAPREDGVRDLKPQDFGVPIDIELDFAASVGYRLYDILDDSAITRHEHGFLVRVSLPENDWLYEFLMSFGDRVKILRPESLRKAIIKKYRAALSCYHESDD